MINHGRKHGIHGDMVLMRSRGKELLSAIDQVLTDSAPKPPVAARTAARTHVPGAANVPPTTKRIV